MSGLTALAACARKAALLGDIAACRLLTADWIAPSILRGDPLASFLPVRVGKGPCCGRPLGGGWLPACRTEATQWPPGKLFSWFRAARGAGPDEKPVLPRQEMFS